MNKLEIAQKALEDAEVRRAEIARALQNVTDELSTEDIDALNSDFDAADEEVISRKAGVASETRIQAAIDAAPAPAAEVTPALSVTEAPVYAKGNATRSYFADLYHAQRHMDTGALERLRKNDAMTRDELTKRGLGDVELRETGATAAAGFIPPIWMADEWAELARPGRPIADRMPKLPLPPDGLTAHIPKVSTGLTEAAQTASGGYNDSVASADVTTTTVDASLVTIAGQTDVDRQVLERSLPGLDMVLFDDLMRAYDSELDRQIVNGLTANAEFNGILNASGINSITDSSGTVGTDLLTDVYKAISKVYSLRYMAPTAIYMHPRRAAWLAATQSSTLPIFQQGMLFRTAGTQDDGLAGTFAGLPVIPDANIPTNLGVGTDEDAVIVLYEPDLRLAEGEIRQATYEDVLSGKLAVRLQLYGFNFFWPDRQPKGISVITGTVLAAPTGF